jgi:hypothetical protein
MLESVIISIDGRVDLVDNILEFYVVEIIPLLTMLILKSFQMVSYVDFKTQ